MRTGLLGFSSRAFRSLIILHYMNHGTLRTRRIARRYRTYFRGLLKLTSMRALCLQVLDFGLFLFLYNSLRMDIYVAAGYQNAGTAKRTTTLTSPLYPCLDRDAREYDASSGPLPACQRVVVNDDREQHGEELARERDRPAPSTGVRQSMSRVCIGLTR